MQVSWPSSFPVQRQIAVGGCHHRNRGAFPTVATGGARPLVVPSIESGPPRCTGGLAPARGAGGECVMGSARHDEVERKFDVGAAVVLPTLAGLDGVSTMGQQVEQLLEATYFDTPDLDLAAHG